MANPRIHGEQVRAEQIAIKVRLLKTTREAFTAAMKKESIGQQQFLESIIEAVGAGEVTVTEILAVLNK